MIGSAREQVVVHDLPVVHECPDANLGFFLLEPILGLLAKQHVLVVLSESPRGLLRQHPTPGNVGIMPPGEGSR